MSRPEVEHITIDIKHEDFMKLAFQREIALNRGILILEDDDFVPATVRYNGESTNVKLRLKGDFPDHFDTDKWSFRIEVRGDNTLLGMKQFSIQHPKTRNYLSEWIYHQALKREGVIALRYQFIDVTLNGKDLGIYALEEHFERRLVEHNQLIDGPIVRFNENLRWQLPSAESSGNSAYLKVNIDTFQTGQMLSDPASYVQHAQAIYLLESFRQGELGTSDVFDVPKLAKFFAINDLLGTQHSSYWTNVRFYYNPITSRLEPIGFDGGRMPGIPALSIEIGPSAGPAFFERVFADRLFLEEYIAALERISEPAYLDTLLADLGDELQQNLSIVYSEFPYYDFSESRESYYRNQRYIQRTLSPIKGLHAYYHQSSETQIELELGNIQSMPVEVLGVSYQDSVLFQPVQPIVLPETPAILSEPLDYQIFSFTFPEDFAWSEAMSQTLRVNYKLVGTSRLRQETVFPWSHLVDEFVPYDFIRQEPNAHEFDFLVADDSARAIFVKPGTWTLDRSLILPAGVRVIATSGTRLNLSASSRILSYSPLQFIGSKDQPIVVQSTDSTGQGLVVMNAAETSVLEQVIFLNLANPAQDGWELTGAVTFYESPVEISHSQFIGNRSEDALNIVRSQYSIDNTLFSQTLYDAFDADFAEGRISNSSFETCGNDAIDVSGSVIEIQDVSIDGSGDKGLSAGERSQVTVNHIGIKNADIAVASKDLSQVTIRNIDISDSRIGLTAYQKKSEFGAASIDVLRGLWMTDVDTPYLVEVQSTVVVEGGAVEAIYENVYETLYGGGSK
jgi:hypothetical protein